VQQCPQEAAAAEKASQFTKDVTQLLQSKLSNLVLIEIQKHDKYGGRVLGDVLINGQRVICNVNRQWSCKTLFWQKEIFMV
jgi:hypothetical protein